MLRGLYTSATSMLKNQKKMDVTANNLANASTTGYKKDIAIGQSFDEVLTKRINDINNGITRIPEIRNGTIGNMSLGSDIVEVYTDYSEGMFVKTDSNTDLSIKDGRSAFFAVNVPGPQGNREMYTKNGSFVINNEGYLVNRDGYQVQGQNGPIRLTSDQFTVNSKGQIYQNGQLVDTLRVVQFADTTTLKKYGENLVEAPQGAQTQPFTGQVLQGYIEGSNTNTIDEMVEMITVMRSYEANQKVIKAYDDTLDKVINEVGKV